MAVTLAPTRGGVVLTFSALSQLWCLTGPTKAPAPSLECSFSTPFSFSVTWPAFLTIRGSFPWLPLPSHPKPPPPSSHTTHPALVIPLQTRLGLRKDNARDFSHTDRPQLKVHNWLGPIAWELEERICERKTNWNAYGDFPKTWPVKCHFVRERFHGWQVCETSDVGFWLMMIKNIYIFMFFL